MITVNSISGGKTSCYMAIHHPADVNIFACVCVDDPRCAPKDPALLRYCLDKLNGNFIASAEHDKTLRVMMQLEQLLGREIVWVRGKSFDKVIRQAGCLPTWNRRFCTTEMKILPIFEYLYPRYGMVIENVGFRGDEKDRIDANEEKPDRGCIDYPTSQSMRGKHRLKWEKIHWAHIRFPLRKTYHSEIVQYWRTVHPEFDFPRDSNCRGCHHKPPELLKKNWQETPEIMEWFARQETMKRNSMRKARTGFYTWKDPALGTYAEFFQMNFTEEISFENFTTCNSGGCTD